MLNTDYLSKKYNSISKCVLLMCIPNKEKHDITSKYILEYIGNSNIIEKILIFEKGVLTKAFIEIKNLKDAKKLMESFKKNKNEKRKTGDRWKDVVAHMCRSSENAICFVALLWP